MLVELGLLGSPKRGIIVQTRRGTSLANFLAPPPDHQAKLTYASFRARFGMRWRMRTDASGVYNCAGLVWASRRTCLTEESEWRAILKEDEYRRITSEREVAVGDVVVYVRRGSNEIIHVAKVCEKISMAGAGLEGARPVLKALSKWDNRYGEDVHAIEDVFLNGGEAFDVEYWTDRKN
ncbi:MAG TPA: hypothetical protein VMV10_15930 [Pirellulales bacterium]|nr:hypothetical protein [Pirellulales bacterium]